MPKLNKHQLATLTILYIDQNRMVSGGTWAEKYPNAIRQPTLISLHKKGLLNCRPGSDYYNHRYGINAAGKKAYEAQMKLTKTPKKKDKKPITANHFKYK